MSTMGQIQAHQSVVGSHDGLVDLQVGRAATQALHVDAPVLWVEVESLQRACLTGEFHRVNVLVSSIVTGSRVSFRVFV